MERKAVFSADRRYRYGLTRMWEGNGRPALFIGLNPSTADETHDDPTIRRCIGFARSWGYGGLLVGNLFALQATNPRALRLAADPVGPENDEWLARLAARADLVVAAWGNDGRFCNRAAVILNRFEGIHCLKKNKSGQPAHPLYLNKGLRPTPLFTLNPADPTIAAAGQGSR